MTTPQAPPPFDPGNPLLGETPAQMSTSLVDTPFGQRMALTIRTASTTMTVLLGRDDATTWGQNISQTANGMSGLILAGVGALPTAPLGEEVPR